MGFENGSSNFKFQTSKQIWTKIKIFCLWEWPNSDCRLFSFLLFLRYVILDSFFFSYLISVGGQDKKIYLYDLSNGSVQNTITPNSSHCINSMCIGNYWKKQAEKSHCNTVVYDSFFRSFFHSFLRSFFRSFAYCLIVIQINHEMNEFGFWCVVDGKIQFYSLWSYRLEFLYIAFIL